MSSLKRVLVPAHCISTNEHRTGCCCICSGRVVGNSVIENRTRTSNLGLEQGIKIIRGNTGVRRHVMAGVGASVLLSSAL